MCFHSIKISGKINATILQELRGRGKMKNRAVGIVVLGMMMLLTCMMPAQVLGYISADQTSDYGHPVEGGHIFFNAGTGLITGCEESVTGVVIPEKIGGLKVRGIKEKAFENCKALKKVVIEAENISIGEFAFSECSALESIQFPECVEQIGQDVFYNCSSLKSVEIPDGVTSIERGTFYGCSSLIAVQIPESVTSIGINAFENCIRLEQIKLPEKVTSIGDSAFANCKSLTGISLPTGLKSLGTSAFYKCETLGGIVVIPEGITTIGSTLFLGCKSLKGVKFPLNLESIGFSAFFNCSSLEEAVNVPEGVTEIAENAFYGCSSLKEINLPSTLTSIGKAAFSKCAALTSIIVPQDVLAIESNTFYECSQLASAELPEGLTLIGESAFFNCGSLKEITIPTSVRTIEANAFYNCGKVEKLVIPEGVTEIPGCAFYGCGALSELSLPQSVTSIGDSAFMWCSSLTEITLPENLTDIGAYAFRNCDKLDNVIVPGSVRGILEEAFYNCYNLKSVTLGDGIGEIGKNAFAGCSRLKTLYIPESVIAIGEGAFWEKTALYGSAGCAAQDYASEHGLLFIECSERPEFPSDNEPPENPGGESPETGKQPQTIDVAKSFSKTYGCEPFELDASAKTALTYESSAPSVAAVSEDGTVSVKAGGIATITITAAENEKYKSASARVEIQVNKASQTIGGIVAADITRTYGCRPFHLGASAKTAVTYKSSAPGVAAVSADGIVTVKSGGIVTLTVTAVETAQYKAATKKVVLKINRASQTISGLRSYTKSFRVNGRFSLNAKAKTKLTYKSSNGKIAAVNSAGKVTMKNPGKVTITITAAGTNQYNGTSRKITINTKLKKPVLKVKAYKGRKIRITWSKVSGSSRYQLYVYDSKKKKYIRRLTKKASVKSVMHKGLKSGKVYMYKVRAYRMVSGKKVYSAYSSVKKVRAKR